VSRVLTSHVGTIDLLDLDAIGDFAGRRFLPYPFMYTKPARFAYAHEAEAYRASVPDRFMYGDMQVFTESTLAYHGADIRVECHAQYVGVDTPSVRLVAYRAGDLGFLAEQRPDDDAVDIYTISPYDLGAAIGECLVFDKPGQHDRIVVPEFAPQSSAQFATELAVNHADERSSDVVVPAAEVTVYATVQSHWRQTRNWGLDPHKRSLVWIRVDDDGDYLYAEDFSYAAPMTSKTLQDSIDRLVAEDVAILRDFRHSTAR
jgi:hypothetical protein